MITLRLKPKIGRRVERGHLWVFSNEVDSISATPEAGAEVAVLDPKGNFLGMGLYSASSLIRARIYSRTLGETCDLAFIRKRIAQALDYRRECGAFGHSFRLIHSEADGLPGVVIDVFGDHVVFQISTMAMELRRDAIIAAIIETLNPRAIIERSDMASRGLEGLIPRSVLVHGTPLEPCPIEENGTTILADLLHSQKTGYYLDQVRNRSLGIPFFKEKRVLDLFCYAGSWSIVAAVHGAASAVGIDSSAKAIELARQSAAANHLDPERCALIEEDVFSYLRGLVARKEKFGVVILDPPALAKSRKDAQSALRAYRELNLRAMQVLDDGGMLVSCSCSHHVSADDLRETLTLAAKDTRSDFSIVYQTAQSPDHPIHLQTPETGYLKTFFLRKRGF